MVERRRPQFEVAEAADMAGAGDRRRLQIGGVVEDRDLPHAVQVLLTVGRKVHRERREPVRDGAGVERSTLDHPRQPKAVVAVEVGDADRVESGDGDVGQDALSLGSFAGVEQDQLVVPPQGVGVVGPVSGRGLAGGTQHDQFPGRHGLILEPDGMGDRPVRF